MTHKQEHRHSISTYHLLQHEMVSFLYERFTSGMFFTLIIAVMGSILAAYELALQDRESWVFLWLGIFFVIQLFRFQLKRSYEANKTENYLSHQIWKRRFIVGIVLAAFWQGFGVVLVMPYVSNNLLIIFHAFLMGLGAGAIAYLATSLMIYVCYLVLMILPNTIYLFWMGTPDSIFLGGMHLFMIFAYYFGVKKMNSMISEALNLRFENEHLVNDFERLLGAVAKSNKELDKFATTDELTGASNYRAFRIRLEEYWRTHFTDQLPLSVIMVNIDYYQEYNNVYGMDKGDQTLKAVAQLLGDEIIVKDEFVARMNGAEFAILLPRVSCEGAKSAMIRVLSMLQEQQIEHTGSQVGSLLTLSVGICCAPLGEEVTARGLMIRAENALRMAKDNGRNRIEIINA